MSGYYRPGVDDPLHEDILYYVRDGDWDRVLRMIEELPFKQSDGGSWSRLLHHCLGYRPPIAILEKCLEKGMILGHWTHSLETDLRHVDDETFTWVIVHMSTLQLNANGRTTYRDLHNGTDGSVARRGLILLKHGAKLIASTMVHRKHYSKDEVLLEHRTTIFDMCTALCIPHLGYGSPLALLPLDLLRVLLRYIS